MRFSGAERSQSYRVLLGSCRSTRWGAAPRDWSASVCRLQGFLGQYYFRKPAVWNYAWAIRVDGTPALRKL